MSSQLTISVVVPVYRGEAYLPQLVERLEKVRQEMIEGLLPVRLLETIFVCDEPIDGSSLVLERLAKDREWVTVLHLGMNAGQHSATAAGMVHASGDWIATLDEDGQHDPSMLLGMLIHATDLGLDVCYASPTKAVHHQSWRNLASRGAKALVAALAGDPYVLLFSSFRLVRGDVARAASSVTSQDLYLDVAIRWFTDRVGAVPLEMRDPRSRGSSSGYSLGRLVAHFRRLLGSYHLRVLRPITAGGFAVALGAGALGAGNLLIKLVSPESVPVRGWTSLFVLISFLSGLMLFLLGFILERLSMTLSRVQGRPAFFVADRSRDAVLRAAPRPPTGASG